jgi:hypothetical protein
MAVGITLYILAGLRTERLTLHPLVPLLFIYKTPFYFATWVAHPILANRLPTPARF